MLALRQGEIAQTRRIGIRVSNVLGEADDWSRCVATDFANDVESVRFAVRRAFGKNGPGASFH